MTRVIHFSAIRCLARIGSLPFRLMYAWANDPQIGREHALGRHLADGEEHNLTVRELITWGRRIFCANWTEQDGAGRPQTKGNGQPLSDPTSPLVGSRSLNRLSGPDANSCFGCHNMPFGIPGGGGDFASGVFVLGQRFDFITFDNSDLIPTKGSVDENETAVSLQTFGNFRRSPGLFGAGYIEMLAREMTADLQSIRDHLPPGQSAPLVSKSICFGRVTRRQDGSWDVSEVRGLPHQSLHSSAPVDPAKAPSLIVRPWHQAGSVVSLREFSNNAFNQHHGMQSTERFGDNTDADGDGVLNELTRAEITAVSVFQAVVQVPGRVIPNDPKIEKAIAVGEFVFAKIGCATCHVPSLPLSKEGWTYSEPGKYNPPGNLRASQVEQVKISLIDPRLPQPRLVPASRTSTVIEVPAYTDFRLHNICGPDERNYEPLDQNQPSWSPRFHEGNREFLTKRLWGVGNSPPYFHHGLYNTLRRSVLAHHGEAEASRQAFADATTYERDCLIEFLKSLQVLPPSISDLVVDERFRKKRWPKWSADEVANWIRVGER